MDKFDQFLKSVDLNFIGSGKHKISVENAFACLNEGNAIMVDLRTPEEKDFLNFGFTLNLSLSELPDRFAELPKDKLIILVCSSTPRATIGYLYLTLQGYSDVKLLPNGVSEIANYLKPGVVLKNRALIK